MESPGRTQAAAQTGEWRFRQCFGERAPGEEVHEADLISALEFSHDGERLATGDRGGRVVLFERSNGGDAGSPKRRAQRVDFRYSTEFQSHEPEFDYLKSLEIEEKINQIRWCNRTNGAHFLLSANDKTIKLWKVYERRVQTVSEYNLPSSSSPAASAPAPHYASPSAVPSALPRSPNGNDGPHSASSSRTPCDYGAAEDIARRLGGGANGISSSQHLRLPKLRSGNAALTARCRRTYSNAHAYHINSLSVNCDGETFLSSDDLRINLWHLEEPVQAFNIVDIKPANMENLTEVITISDLHPRDCSVFAYASSKGCIRLADMRDRALCDNHAKVFEDVGGATSGGADCNGNGHACGAGPKTFFSEIIASVTDMKFIGDGRFIVSRDYMTLKLWDVAMDGRGPIASYPVHDHLRPRLGELYESDNLFDKFECCASGGYHSPRNSPAEPSSAIGARYLSTGSYSNLFRIFDARAAMSGAPNWAAEKSAHQLLESSKHPNRYNAEFLNSIKGGGAGRGSPENGKVDLISDLPMDYHSKVLHTAWHPEVPMIAAAATNSLYMFSSV